MFFHSQNIIQSCIALVYIYIYDVYPQMISVSVFHCINQHNQEEAIKRFQVDLF